MSMNQQEYARKRAEQRQQSSWFKLKEGDNWLRILPTPRTKRSEFDFHEYAVHREVGPKKLTVRCGISPVSGEGECWLCDKKIPALKAKGMEERAKALQSKAIFLVQVAKVDVDNGGKMTGPFLFTPAKTVADQLLKSIFGARKKSYIDPVKGYNLNVPRTGTGKLDTTYGMIESDEDPTKVPTALLDKVKPFEELKEIPIYSQAKQQAAYTGQPLPEDEAPAEEEERPRSNKRKPAEETEDEEFAEESEETADDEDVGEDEDEPKPKQKAKVQSKPGKPAAKKPVDDDDEDTASDEDDVDFEADGDDEDLPPPEEAEDEDEPKPKPKAKPAAGKKKPSADDDGDEPDLDVDLDAIEAEGGEEDGDGPKSKPKAKPAAGGIREPKPKARR